MKDRIKITKQSFTNLTSRHIGAGTVFIHTGNKEVTSFDFYRAMNGNFYQVNNSFTSTPLSDVFTNIARELKHQEGEKEKLV